MCLILNLYSPLEQFEISSCKTMLNYISTSYVPFEIYYLNNIWPSFIEINYISFESIFLILFFITIFYIFKEYNYLKGYLVLILFIFIISTNLNILSFNDLYLSKDIEIMFFEQLNIFFYFQETFEYITIITSYINVYSVSFCFIFIYFIMYLIYNKMLSNNTNSLIPTFYQIIGENLYKISLNLFYSILGKNISIPEFFIKINTIFIFLILSNIQGMIPYMNTLTSALTNTFFIALALFISILTTLFDKKGLAFFFNLFMPPGCPILLSLLIIPIELISYSFRLVSLSVRLFANMMAGHTLLKVIVGFSWIIIFLGNTSLINLFPILILMILTLLEFGVALIQAYIFTVLSCIYLRDIFEGH